MNTSHLPTTEDADPAISISAWAILASLLIGALFYLGSYSMGPDFMEHRPELNRQFVAEGGM